MATCCEVAGIEYPQEYKGNTLIPLRGKSLVSVFQGNVRDPHRFLFWEHEGNRAIRVNNWKLVAQYKQPWELYNLNNDRAELYNLAAEKPGLLKELTEKYDSFAKVLGVIERK